MGGRSDAPRKGDLREQALLDAAEALLEHTSLEELTVEAIAKGAGISRGSLYFASATNTKSSPLSSSAPCAPFEPRPTPRHGIRPDHAPGTPAGRNPR
ncbi:TetR family transcriptional regulator [Streptomyces coffeae]|uniref:TetR family transcriptional regulator n=1 Tax=Streptomyces coffeae TaxID=621382 RepID=UPI0027DCE1CC|nr:TetR family transcriptional regulator [Streptomyces coffeae]